MLSAGFVGIFIFFFFCFFFLGLVRKVCLWGSRFVRRRCCVVVLLVLRIEYCIMLYFVSYNSLILYFEVTFPFYLFAFLDFFFFFRR